MKYTKQDREDYVSYLNSEIKKESIRIFTDPREELISNFYKYNLHRDISGTVS